MSRSRCWVGASSGPRELASLGLSKGRGCAAVPRAKEGAFEWSDSERSYSARGRELALTKNCQFENHIGPSFRGSIFWMDPPFLGRNTPRHARDGELKQRRGRPSKATPWLAASSLPVAVVVECQSRGRQSLCHPRWISSRNDDYSVGSSLPAYCKPRQVRKYLTQAGRTLPAVRSQFASTERPCYQSARGQRSSEIK